MSIEIVKVEDQGKGQFNGGEILENKPIGFPQDEGMLKPYSNLFYWAHAWTDVGSTIGEHPHKGFEIMSFVVKGEIEHYDSKLQGWKKLKEGDAQIIRSGNGISHAEKMYKGAQIFQIWIDPNLNVTLDKPASYDDYASESFPVTKNDGITTKVYKGENAPMQMDTEGVSIKEHSLVAGQHTLELDNNAVYSFFVINGIMDIDGNEMKKGDFAVIKEQDSVKINCSEESRLFTIESPLRPGYPTYAEMYGR